MSCSGAPPALTFSFHASLLVRCQRKHGWTLKKTRDVARAYKQLMCLKKELEDWDAIALSPSEAVDLMWHEHLLDPKDYHNSCENFCGEIIGHNPDGGLDVAGRAMRRRATLEALTSTFGAGNFDSAIWNIDGPRESVPRASSPMPAGGFKRPRQSPMNGHPMANVTPPKRQRTPPDSGGSSPADTQYGGNLWSGVGLRSCSSADRKLDGGNLSSAVRPHSSLTKISPVSGGNSSANPEFNGGIPSADTQSVRNKSNDVGSGSGSSSPSGSPHIGQRGCFQIRVTDRSKEEMSFVVRHRTTIRSIYNAYLKRKYALLGDSPEKEEYAKYEKYQIVLFDGSRMLLDKTLGDYDAEEGDVIDVLLPTLGC